MNMWLLQVVMCEKCRSILVLLEEGSKTFLDSGEGGGEGLTNFRTRDVTNLEEGLLLQGEGSAPYYMPCYGFIIVLYIHPKSL